MPALNVPAASNGAGAGPSAPSRVERIHDVLRSLRAVSPDIIGSAMVSTDGFIIRVRASSTTRGG